MATNLRVNQDFIEQTAQTASHRYKSYQIPKRRGGYRDIHHPAKPLKALQRWLLDNVVVRFPVHPSAFAYRDGRHYGTRANAARHQGSAYLLRLDFADFFPSITSGDIRALLEERASGSWAWWSKNDTDLFCNLVCRYGQLTIGAPTSPSLSNAMCFSLDAHCTALAEAVAAKYTRYADDLFFSVGQQGVLTRVVDEVRQLLPTLAYPRGLRLREDKTTHLSKRQRRVVTGMVLGSDGGLSIGRSQKQRLRAMIHQFLRLSHGERAFLAGWLAHCADVEPEFINSLILAYGVERVDDARSPPR